MSHLLLSVFGLFFLSLTSFCASEDDPSVVTSSGPIKGKRILAGSGSVTAYLGIPYAKPPLGKLRFQKPLPHPPWSHVLETTRFGNSCPQTNASGLLDVDIWTANTPLSEDCLFLNVWVPHPKPSTPAPLLVWIQGMGYITGTASLEIYDGAVLAVTENVIVASMNYRLGALGFLYMPPHAPGNIGLWDQHLALKWLKENAAVFGGNPTQLTLVGHSAGAAMVGFHLLSPVSQPLFSHAVLQSGVPNALWPWKNPKEAKLDAETVSKQVGCTQNADIHVVQCLQRIEIWDKKFSHLTAINSLTIDGEFLPDEPEKLLETADLRDKSVLTGILTDEGSTFVLYMYSSTKTNGGTLTWEQLHQGVMRTMPKGTDEAAAKTVALKFSESFHGPERYRLAFAQYFRDYFFVCSLNEFAAKIREAGRPVYVYSFDHRTSGSIWPEWVETPYGSEVPYLFGSLTTALQTSQPVTETEKALSHRVMRYWAEFARSGNPTGSTPNEVEWPLYNAKEKKLFHISTGAPQLKPMSPTPHCDFLASLKVNETCTSQDCMEDVDECQLIPNVCQNGGTCHNTPGSYNCDCVNGWTGKDCSENIDDCLSGACFTGATCHDRVTSFYCECPPGRTGLLCHLNDACIGNPCNEGCKCDTNLITGKIICTCPSHADGSKP
ncbi:cholinesterase-like isoform X1 [Sceloporus undulatus]|uniref:cholinesterase-like isoform X1 n=1 Tax=Sceloporus undulatus TaxID=8520 RepID=UPI001C4DB6EF|nr:cholinesterase-like isoform X1 [Sceloporus undulatus]XP_042310891.1 cholinesterase-like isoform X1 [Sceloporus undulatus]